jgi:hypothetical protein
MHIEFDYSPDDSNEVVVTVCPINGAIRRITKQVPKETILDSSFDVCWRVLGSIVREELRK